jgi:hypothetical protein
MNTPALKEYPEGKLNRLPQKHQPNKAVLQYRLNRTSGRSEHGLEARKNYSIQTG